MHSINTYLSSLLLTQPQLTVLQQETKKTQTIVHLLHVVETAVGKYCRRICIRMFCNDRKIGKQQWRKTEQLQKHTSTPNYLSR